jgi:hypothetical protein
MSLSIFWSFEILAGGARLLANQNELSKAEETVWIALKVIDSQI